VYLASVWLSVGDSTPRTPNVSPPGRIQAFGRLSSCACGRRGLPRRCRHCAREGRARCRGAKAYLIGLGVLSVISAWATVHTTFTFGTPGCTTRPSGGINFNERAAPAYLDFAYVAFTIGMTFQVSDTNLTSQAVRRTALRHGLLSFLFGVVIVGMTINVVASLLK